MSPALLAATLTIALGQVPAAGVGYSNTGCSTCQNGGGYGGAGYAGGGYSGGYAGGGYSGAGYTGSSYGDAYGGGGGSYGDGGGFSGGGASPGGDRLYNYDAYEPWVHGYWQEIPAYGGFCFYRPYNYKHVLSQSQVAGGWGMSPTMPYSHEYFRRGREQGTYEKKSSAIERPEPSEQVRWQPPVSPRAPRSIDTLPEGAVVRAPGMTSAAPMLRRNVGPALFMPSSSR